MAHRFFGLASAVAALLACTQPASAQQYSSLLVFGDSLVDSGNARIGAMAAGLGDVAPPSLGYFDGRFTNGYNFADYLSRGIIGAPATASLEGGQNFAFGGALAAYSPTERPPSFLPQLYDFATSGRTIDPNALVLITFGGNDLRSVADYAGPIDYSATLTAMASGIAALVGAGANNIVVTGLPDIGDLPATRALASALGDPDLVARNTQRSFALNQLFGGLVSTLDSAYAADIRFFDLFGYEQALLADPGAFGFAGGLRTDMSCIAAGAVASGCDGFLYFDAIHPTTQVHGAIASAIGAQVGVETAVPEPSIWVALFAGFALVGGMLRWRRKPSVQHG